MNGVDGSNYLLLSTQKLAFCNVVGVLSAFLTLVFQQSRLTHVLERFSPMFYFHPFRFSSPLICSTFLCRIDVSLIIIKIDNCS